MTAVLLRRSGARTLIEGGNRSRVSAHITAAGATLKTRRSATPANTCVYAIGDIHGRADLLEAMLGQIDADSAAVEADRKILLFIGDYVDRGEESKRVIELVIQAQAGDLEVIALRGNHEEALLAFLRDPKIGPSWMSHGGDATLHAYGVELPPRLSERNWGVLSQALYAAMPAEHRMFLEATELSAVIGDYFFCHAGARPGVPLTEQAEEDLLWIREDFLGDAEDFEKVIVHGHTPEQAVFSDERRIGLDTGAYATGFLSAVRLHGEERSLLTVASGGQQTLPAFGNEVEPAPSPARAANDESPPTDRLDAGYPITPFGDERSAHSRSDSRTPPFNRKLAPLLGLAVVAWLVVAFELAHGVWVRTSAVGQQGLAQPIWIFAGLIGQTVLALAIGGILVLGRSTARRSAAASGAVEAELAELRSSLDELRASIAASALQPKAVGEIAVESPAEPLELPRPEPLRSLPRDVPALVGPIKALADLVAGLGINASAVLPSRVIEQAAAAASAGQWEDVRLLILEAAPATVGRLKREARENDLFKQEAVSAARLVRADIDPDCTRERMGRLDARLFLLLNAADIDD